LEPFFINMSLCLVSSRSPPHQAPRYLPFFLSPFRWQLIHFSLLIVCICGVRAIELRSLAHVRPEESKEEKKKKKEKKSITESIAFRWWSFLELKLQNRGGRRRHAASERGNNPGKTGLRPAL
jgi:hypothetical protein